MKPATIDFAQRTVECTKSALGLKFYMVLAALGEKKLGEFIDRQYELAIQAYEYLNNLPEFECALPPQSNIVCFRIRGDDAMQMRIRDTMIAEGSFYISSTLFHGKRYLRLALMNPLTSMNDIERLARRINPQGSASGLIMSKALRTKLLQMLTAMRSRS